MKILPVLDLLEGIVVRSVAGNRDRYRAVESCLSGTANPLDVARGFREKLGLEELYVADLDAILDDRPNHSVYRALAADGFRFLLDAGIRDEQRAEELFACGAAGVIAGLETIADPAVLEALCARFGPARVVFSLDLKSGRPMGELAAWGTTDPLAIGVRAAAAGVGRMIVLDLAGVGVGQGVPTLPLCRRLRDRIPQLELITGGGVRDAGDVRTLAAEHVVDAVLVASALHNGQIGRADIQTVES